MDETVKAEVPAFQKGTEIAKGFLKNYKKKAKPASVWKILGQALMLVLFSYAAAATAMRQEAVVWQVFYWLLCALFAGMSVMMLVSLRNLWLWSRKQEVYMMRWLQKRCKEDNKPELRYVLGYAYETGALGEQNDALAVQWFEKAGSYPFAQNDLAVHYALGQGVGRDVHRAKKLFRDAGKSGCFFAPKNLELLEKM